MIIDAARADAIFYELAEKVRSSVRQSRDALIQATHRRLAKNPGDRAAIHLLAASSLQNRNPQKSLATLHKDQAALEEDAVGRRLAGYACLAQKDIEAARRHFDRSIQLDPCQPDCWTMLGKIHENSGQPDLAIRYYERGLTFDDPDHESALALCRLYARSQRLQDAIHTLRVALLRDRRSAKLNFALAKLLQRRAGRLGRKARRRAQQRILEEAWQCYQTANRSAPTSATYVAQGIIEQRLEKFAEAHRTFQRAVALDPECPRALTHMASSNVDAGHIERALDEYQAAIAVDPERSTAHFRYSRAKRFKPGCEADQYIELLTTLVSDDDRQRLDQVQLNFALAKVLDDIGRYEEAWRHYDRANRLKPGHTKQISLGKRRGLRRLKRRTRLPVPLQDVADASRQFFTRKFFASHRELGHPSRKPVFIVGVPRSGTTLTEQILSSHPDIAGAGELKLIDRIRSQILDGFRGSALDKVYPNLLARLDRNAAQELAGGYLAHLESICSGQRRVTDKMPTNFIHLGLIATLFPQATVIHCRRNPMDVLVSCYCQHLSPPFCDLEQLVRYHRQYRRMMAHWNEVLPLKIHTVDYESLVTDPEPNSRALIEHCGLPWDDRCLEFHKNDRAVHTPSKWQVRQPMYSSSIEKWRRFEPFLQGIARKIAQD